jgi:hypothetical protein
MKLFARFGAVLGLAAIVAGVLSAPAQAAAPVLIKSCTVAKPKPFSHMAGGTRISFVNMGKRTASEITFAVGYRNAASHYLRRVDDVGSFAPGATITHLLPLYNDVTYSGATTASCMPVRVKWAGGTLWVAPSH